MIIELSKGYQFTVPAKVRNKYGLKPGDKVEVEETDEGILLRTKETTWEEIFAERDKFPPMNMTPEELDELEYDLLYR